MGLADKKKIWSRATADPRIGMTLCAAAAAILGLAAYWTGTTDDWQFAGPAQATPGVARWSRNDTDPGAANVVWIDEETRNGRNADNIMASLSDGTSFSMTQINDRTRFEHYTVDEDLGPISKTGRTWNIPVDPDETYTGQAIQSDQWCLGPQGKTAIMAGLAAFMAMCWVTEVVPIPVTSLFPLALFPLFGVAPLDEVSASYGKPVIYLFLGGFLLALGLQRSGVHRRIALWIVDHVGSQPSRLILGFMLASAGLSMWISNTATVLVMLPIALAVLQEAKQSGVSKPALSKFGVALMLGIAYAADIGGMATPVGTPPNLVLLQLYAELVPDKPPLGFGQWMIMGLPLSAIFLSCGWLLLTKVVFRFPRESLFGETDVIRSARESLGIIRRDEWITVIVFIVAAVLWMTRADLRFGAFTIPGWQSLLGLDLVGDASVAIAAAAILFMIPSTDHPGETLLTWKQARDIPWGLLLLFGGGFALAKGFELSGLSESIGEALTAFKDVHPIVLVATVCLFITFLTEVTSNTATTSLILPILAEASRAMGIDPLLLMIPATLSASCAFMMPVASPTQAIVFGSGYVSIRQMVRAGIWFNLLGVFLVTTIFLLVAKPVFGIQW